MLRALNSLTASVLQEVPKHLARTDATGVGEVYMHHGALLWGAAGNLSRLLVLDWD